MDKPVYKRTVTRRESYRIDLEADEVRAALSSALGEDIPESAAFRVHDDGGITFCWDIDYDVDGPAIERVEPAPAPLHSMAITGRIESNQDGSSPSAQDNRTVITVVPLDEPVQNPAGQTLVVGDGERHPIGELSDDPATPWEEIPHEDIDRERQRLVNIATGRTRTDHLSPYEKNLARHGVVLDKPAVGHFEDERSEDKQCRGEFHEGVSRKFRCHLDARHVGPCGAAEGCEPEDPPKGRRRSW